ncbi:MAG: tetraacyldisaccharide 4'-kinase [Lautropia sp.]|nr:tetraacyldisaccharide 4'-kinase [Lautropia sp.]
MIIEHLRRQVEAWLMRIWFCQPRGSDRLLAALLAPIGLPLSWLVASLALRRARQIQHSRSGHPVVIVIGNVVVGGAGKTPLVAALARALQDRGLSVGLLARGYRAHSAIPILVDRNTPIEQAGDEALLLASETGLPLAVGLHRQAALALLIQHYPELDVVISDDGLQHVALPRHLELVLMHPLGLGNGRCLPAGPLREPPERLKHVDALLLPASPTLEHEGTLPSSPLPEAGLSAGHAAQPPQFRIRTEVVGVRTLDGQTRCSPADFRQAMAGQTLAAVAGISRPERFFNTLRGQGLTIQPYPLPDHARLDPAWLAVLPQAQIIMTAKDAVKCAALPDSVKRRCHVLEIQAVPEAALLEWLAGRLDTVHGARHIFPSAHH